MLRSLRNPDETQDVRLYISSHDGKILKSLSGFSLNTRTLSWSKNGKFLAVGNDGRESDTRLLERVAGGDRDAFTALYRRFARPVFAMAVRRLGDNGRPEKSPQATVARVSRSAGRHTPERAPAQGEGSLRALAEAVRRTPTALIAATALSR